MRKSVTEVNSVEMGVDANQIEIEAELLNGSMITIGLLYCPNILGDYYNLTLEGYDGLGKINHIPSEPKTITVSRRECLYFSDQMIEYLKKIKKVPAKISRKGFPLKIKKIKLLG